MGFVVWGWGLVLLGFFWKEKVKTESQEFTVLKKGGIALQKSCGNVVSK